MSRFATLLKVHDHTVERSQREVAASQQRLATLDAAVSAIDQHVAAESHGSWADDPRWHDQYRHFHASQMAERARLYPLRDSEADRLRKLQEALREALAARERIRVLDERHRRAEHKRRQRKEQKQAIEHAVHRWLEQTP